MYVIAMKNRPYEISAMKQLQKHGYLRPGMVPLVEIIKETHKCDDLVDPETGAPIKRKQRCNDGVVRSYINASSVAMMGSFVAIESLIKAPNTMSRCRALRICSRKGMCSLTTLGVTSVNTIMMRVRLSLSYA